MGEVAKDPDDPTGGTTMGNLHRFKGRLTVVARVVTSKVKTENPENSSDRNPVFYVARITQSKEPIKIGDKIYIFKHVE